MIKKGISFVIAAAMALMCFAGMGPAVASAAETEGSVEKYSPVIIITGSDYLGSSEYNEETISKEIMLTLDDLKAIAAEDDEAAEDNYYIYSALNTWDNTSIYGVEGVRANAVFDYAGIINPDSTEISFAAQDGFKVYFDPYNTELSKKECNYTGQAFSKTRYYYPNIGELRTLLKTKTVDELTRDEMDLISAGGSEVPITIAWAKTDSKGVIDPAEIGELERWDEDDNDRVQLAVGALEVRDYNNPLWNGDTGCLTVSVGDIVGGDLIKINGKGYTRPEFISNDAEIKAYTYQTQNGTKTKYAKGIKVANFIKQFADNDIVGFTSADTNETVYLTKKEIVDGNYMLAYETGDSADALEPVYEEEGDIKGFFTLYGDDVRPSKFINNVTVTAAPEAPQAFSAKRASSTSIKLSWNAVYGAKGYNVYRSAAEEGPYKVIANLEGADSVTFADEDIATGDKYFYKVAAYDMLESLVFEGSETEVLSAAASPAVPSNFKAARSSYNSIKLTWSKVSGADGYYIYRYNASKKVYVLHMTIKSGSTVSYSNTGLATGTKYSYKIKSYADGNNGIQTSGYSAVKAATPTLTKPTIKLTAGSKKITVKWNRITGATGYKVYRATSKTGKYTCVKTVKSGKTVSFVNKSLKKGKRYYYKVRAYRSVNGKLKYSSYSTVKYTRAK